MLRLLVADDEKYDREAIISILNLAFGNEFDISEAKNGREAIEISERIRPDIIIMDIKMPGINGLQAILEIRKFLPNAYIIILTAYDYFDFAVEAVKNNVKEYILKPFSRSDITEKIKAAAGFVNMEREKRKREIENQERLYNLMPVLENELSYSIINNSITSIDYETYLRYLGVDFQKACSMVVKFKDEPTIKNIKVQIGEYVKEYIERRYKTIASYRFTKNIVYFLQLKEQMDEYEARFDIVNLAADIRREVRRVFDVSIKIGIGQFYNGLNLMHQSYEEACSSLEFISESINVVHFQDIKNSMNVKESSSSKIQGMEKEKIAVFKRVEQYIAENIKEELDLEKTAAKFNLSSYYFSRSFKEVLGFNFSDYINMLRIRKAKELLKGDSLSIKEICYSVGYSDPNYFSKVFKKYEGVTPSEFKVKFL
ncbi:response regulator [Clostridium swellfunianum]|uniref:helix-turn-helix domain-containing protein n=1 Tax=Clostridium swellfunianum TaxID=1367462 RepID=UPI00203024EF|nr:helix-turn-helix domain-containing protein [Clostridium swellfunianum]MCM0649625.1 response regulator [Clostridium swellfunianum]